MITDDWLEHARIAPDIFALRPDYHAVLITARGLTGGPSHAISESLVSTAEGHART